VSRGWWYQFTDWPAFSRILLVCALFAGVMWAIVTVADRHYQQSTPQRWVPDRRYRRKPRVRAMWGRS